MRLGKPHGWQAAAAAVAWAAPAALAFATVLLVLSAQLGPSGWTRSGTSSLASRLEPPAGFNSSGGDGGGCGSEAQGEGPILPGERSFFRSWIERDLLPWNETGITQQMVQHAFAMGRLCVGTTFRVQIVNGSLWGVNAAPLPHGYYPSGAGAISGAGRVSYMMFALLDALHEIPGQIPDVDLVLNPSDFPCISHEGRTNNGKWPTPPWVKTPGNAAQVEKEAAAAGFATPAQRAAAAAPPILSFTAHRAFRDIPFPDYTFYGHLKGSLADEQGRWLWGWDSQLAFFQQRFGSVPLAQRKPSLVWRGRTAQGNRDGLRRTFVGCQKVLKDQGRDPSVLNVWGDRIDVKSACNWRYVGYLESRAWSTSFKYRLLCGSVLVTPVIEFPEWYTRALQPGVHYIEIAHQPGEMCLDIERNVHGMNAWLDREQQAAAAPNSSATPAAAGEGVAAAAVAAAGEQAARRRRLAAVGPPVKARTNYSNSWDSDLPPEEVARNGQQFLLDHVRMRDVRLYLRDLLQAYARLQRFQPRPQPGAVKVTGNQLLHWIAVPHKVDAYQVASRYTWLPFWDMR